ncbi:hypothetical protein [Alicyclobacillus acidiphilus]|uniref:hypothetical protein n=1 Tax=Alicyclobacillus acidiphilus TaxID=182455 RepID=UPI000A9312B7|nr:hypothetical protein [Alicyclobacillus acidiphilus]
MCTRAECMAKMGQWVQFRTQWGTHRGIISGVNNQAVLVRVPRQYAPVGLATAAKDPSQSDEARLDLALAGYGYGPYRYRGWGYPGNGWWYGGWWWWWLAFAWVFALAFLW